ncbi:putative lipid II flippase FtsW [Agrococcus jenensis]|uniref:Probable peptidoglycan glycosyltransferase FtsW n=1 Tax=Agrococcus jenensis TaxID=46353 RepID=A0A3N2AUU0_9MICO|nr:putative lipid II flippase FtsW [Agrococcus jenensis]ROR66668.1 cell division-specific peptidoglycan biosynthesis regulator FtsW [Agrococcus jenensis]
MVTTTAPASTTDGGRAERTGRRALVRVRSMFGAPTLNAALLLGTTLFLVAFGLIMVLSSSSVESYVANASFFTDFAKQGAFAAIGIVLMLLAARLPATIWQRLAWIGVGLGIALQMLVFTPLGFGANGNRNWIGIGGFSLQPSEFVKVALCVWLAMIMTRKQKRIDSFWQAWIPAAPVAGLSIGLVLLGSDLGTVVIMVMLSFGALWFAGVKWWHLLLPVAGLVLLAVPVVLSSPSRVRRISAFVQGCTDADYYSGCWQQLHGTWALSAGGLFGVGLGNSRAKWSWLPEADNDYIFAIIGEELGLLGAAVVLALFALLAWTMLRIVRQATLQMTRVVTGAATVWLIGQAIVNIGVVLGLLPVLGVPLPFISSGGSQLIAALLIIGIVLSLERVDNPRYRGELSARG